ncbi:hypothetical protein CDD81_352 [Ophiocordyceps australis]|uniref:Carrier domain-containing protein n=1 Tax=Ophiocordyceps australis TaxID=1399860 RepID=A0A2C5Y3A9_9HYPO|nr:hypothetical protein CDD81_352 [Ophiocordyceps australis]
MQSRLVSWLHNTPAATAIVNGSITLSYRDLFNKAKAIAWDLYQSGLAQNEPVGIIYDASHEQIIAQVGVLVAGGTCVSISLASPLSRIVAMLHDIKVKRVIADKNGPFKSDEFSILYLNDVLSGNCEQVHFDIPARQGVYCSHILFTSGTTGKPKAVQISNQGILHLATKTPVTPFCPGDRLAAFNDTGFDLSLFETWATLLSGASIVLTPKATVTDASGLQAFFTREKISITIIPTALFNIIASACPGTFGSLKHVVVTGEPASRAALRAVLESNPPQHLWNAYGPTEGTTFATMHEMTMQETRRDRLTIGGAIGQMRVCLVDEQLKVIEESQQRGEICIAGPQVSLGYLNAADQNESSFIHLTEAALTGARGPGSQAMVRLYRSGDMAEWRSGERLLDFIGRADSQVKLGGFRVELGEVEETLFLSRLLKSISVVVQPATRQGSTAQLVAFVVPENEASFRADDLLAFARARLPHYMVPRRVQIISKLPISARGKIDGQALLQSLEQGPSPCHSVTRLENGADKNGNAHLLGQIWSNVLGISCIADHDNLVSLGASSLQNAALIAQIKTRMGRLISMHDLYRHAHFSQLLDFINSSSESIAAPDDCARWIQDTHLADDIQLVPSWDAHDQGYIFLTGATGFLGAYLLQQFLLLPCVKQVACLVRASSCAEAAQRIEQNMRQYDLWPADAAQTSKIKALHGDVARHDLGLGQETFTWLSNWASAIFHAAAKVNFCDSYHEHYASNVCGTRNILRLAALGRRKILHYLSSIDVWGQTGYFLGTKTVLEDEPIAPHIQGLRHDIGYAQSKWTAEGMVRRMRHRGLPVIIYRPGFIMGHSKTGASNPKDYMSRHIIGCIQLGLWPNINMRVEYVTVDYVVSALLHISRSSSNIGRSFSLLSPILDDSVRFNDTCAVIKDAGFNMLLADYKTWLNALIEKADANNPLLPIMPMLQEQVFGKLTRTEVSENCPFYDSRNTVQALKGRDDIRYVPLTPDLVKRYIAFWDRKGFYSV